jgi:hypothetical protein
MKTYMIAFAFCSFMIGCSDANFDVNLEEHYDADFEVSFDFETGISSDVKNDRDSAVIDSTSDSISSDVSDGVFVDLDDTHTTYFVHENGLGQTWTDGVPLKTYNRFQAINAGTVWPYKDTIVIDVTCSADVTTRKCVAFSRADRSATWCYEGSIAGRVKLSESTSGPPSVLCPSIGDKEWK